MIDRSFFGAALGFALAVTAFVPVGAQQTDGSSTQQPAQGQPETEQAFEPQEFDVVPDGTRPTRGSRYETLSGVELEGVRTHSILLTRLPRTSIYRDSMATGLLTSSISVPDSMNLRDTDHCTATLIDADVVMTAYHCFPGVTSHRKDRGYVADRAEVTFGYYSKDSVERSYPVAKVIDADAELDFAILQLDVPERSRPPSLPATRSCASHPSTPLCPRSRRVVWRRRSFLRE